MTDTTSSAPAEFPGAGAADLTPLLRHLLGGGTLDADQTTRAFDAMMTGRVHHGEIGAFLALLATRTPTPDEILGAARVMRAHVDVVPTSIDRDRLVDTAGTGGAPKTFNVSTASAIVAAAGGVPIAKHGNRSRTGRGSAEVLIGLGVNVDASREVQERCLAESNICFCFAPHHHPATRHVMPVRKTLGFPTIFNLLGPLTNPAGARRQVMGVYAREFVRPIANALAQLDTIRAVVVHSADGLDELSVSDVTHACIVEGSDVHDTTIDPREFGLPFVPQGDVVARDLDHAIAMVRDILSGTDRGGPRSMTVLASAATLYVAGIAESLENGCRTAESILDSGAAMETLATLASTSHAAGPPLGKSPS